MDRIVQRESLHIQGIILNSLDSFVTVKTKEPALNQPKDKRKINIPEHISEKLQRINPQSPPIDKQYTHMDLIDLNLIVQRIIRDAPQIQGEHHNIENQPYENSPFLPENVITVINQNNRKFTHSLKVGNRLKIGGQGVRLFNEQVIRVTEGSTQNE